MDIRLIYSDEDHPWVSIENLAHVIGILVARKNEHESHCLHTLIELNHEISQNLCLKYCVHYDTSKTTTEGVPPDY